MTAPASLQTRPPWHRSPAAVALFALLAIAVLIWAGFLLRPREEPVAPAPPLLAAAGPEAGAAATSGTAGGAGGVDARLTEPRVPTSGEIRGIQEDLRLLDFYRDEITGEWDEATVGALMSFQRWAGLRPDGLWGPRTAAAVQAALDTGSQQIGADLRARS